MTITSRKRANPSEDLIGLSEPGFCIACDACGVDLTHSIRIKCADPICETSDAGDICPSCFCRGAEFAKHKNTHPYRVVELHSYPIFTEDWGADEELLLIDGLLSQGMGNWSAVAEHVGTRTKEEVERHYNEVYIDSQTYPVPPMDRDFDIEPDVFQERKRRRIEKLNNVPPPVPQPHPVSAPGVHEIAHYLPGRLEFEVEIDNEAEDLIKDLEFGVVSAYGGDEIPEDPLDVDVKAREKWEEARRAVSETPRPTSGGSGDKQPFGGGKFLAPPMTNGVEPKKEDANGNDDNEDDNENMEPPPFETTESIAFKLALLDMYASRIRKRKENKSFILDRGLLDIKKFKERDKEQGPKEYVSKFKIFARIQTALDYEQFLNGLLYELTLRRRIRQLQDWRRLGLTSPQEADKYDREFQLRTQRQTLERGYIPPGVEKKSLMEDGRHSKDRDPTPRPGHGRRLAAPLNLATAPSLHLLSTAEQTLCSQLRILPKAYLVIKETLVREFVRRGGKLRRREARELLKIDVNKTSRVWDFLVQAGVLRLPGGDTAPAHAEASNGPPSLALLSAGEPLVQTPSAV